MPRPEYFVYPITDKPYHQKFFYSRISKEDAQRKAEEWKAAHLKNPVYFKGLALQWLEEMKQHKTPQNYMATYETPTNNHIIPYFGDRAIADIKPPDIETFYRRNAELSQSTLNKIKICLTSIFSLAVERGFVQFNIVANIMPKSKQTPNEKRVLSQKQLNEYYSAIESHCPEAAIILLTGMRIGEICGIRTDDANNVDPDVVPIYRSVMPDGTINPPNNKYVRFIPCKQAADLIRHISIGVPIGYLFGHGNTPPKPAAITARITRVMVSLDLPDLSPNELRHTYYMNLYRHNVDTFAIQRLMGISSNNGITSTNELDLLRYLLKSAGM